MSFNPVVSDVKCTGCEECVDVCPVEVFAMQNGKSVVANGDDCLGCESCVEACPADAIEI